MSAPGAAGPPALRPVVAADIPRIARIHAEAFPGDFVTLMGDAFLARCFYPELLRVAQVALCAEDERSGEVVGFVFFTTDRGYLGRIARRHFPAMVGGALRRALRPAFWGYAFVVLALMASDDRRLQGAELSYIAVDGDRRRQGVGGALTDAGLRALESIGIRQCWLKTLASTPETERFYGRYGFRRLKVSLGRVFLVRDAPVSRPPDAGA